MSISDYRSALIVGVGPGISASLARHLSSMGMTLGLAARDIEKLKPLAEETGAKTFAADAADAATVAGLFQQVEGQIGPPDVVVYNAGSRELDPDAVEKALAVLAFGGFLVTQQAAKRMIPRGYGAILLTGATASLKGFAGSAAFAMGKFALRGLAQSAARELGPKGIHVAHVVIDGVVRAEHRPDRPGSPDSTLEPGAIAQTYIDVLSQPRSAWSFEVELRPWTETF